MDITAKGWFNIPGRGTIACVDLGHETVKVGQYIKIDGKRCKIRAIEVARRGVDMAVDTSDVGLVVTIMS